jgi:hypothetical protein
MSSRPVTLALYRALLRSARRFDRTPAAKALITFEPSLRETSWSDEEDEDSSTPAPPLHKLVYEREVASAINTSQASSSYFVTTEAAQRSFVDHVRAAFRRPLSCSEAASTTTDSASSPSSSPHATGAEDGTAVTTASERFDHAVAEANARIDAGFSALGLLGSKWAWAERLGLPTSPPYTPKRKIESITLLERPLPG